MFRLYGLGGRGSDFANTHFNINVADLRAAMARMETGRAPSLTIGQDWAGPRCWWSPSPKSFISLDDPITCSADRKMRSTPRV